MRTDAAAVAGVADHQVVQARVRHEAELAQQFVGALVVEVGALDQHGPAWFGAGRQFRQRTMLHVPLAIALGHQARFDVVLPGQLGQLVELEQRLEARNGLADQEGFLVPVIAQELSGSNIPKKL